LKIQVDPRHLFMSALVALVLMAGVLLSLAPKASAVTSDCPSGKICLWAGQTFGGQQSFWNAWETGCHALANIDPRSVRNNTGNRTAWLPGWGAVGPGVEVATANPYTGELCIQ